MASILSTMPTIFAQGTSTAKRPKLHWSLAVIPPLIAWVLQSWLWEYVEPFAWFLFYPAVFVSARLGGLRGGLLATLLATCLAWWSFIIPIHTMAAENPGHYFPAAMFVCMGVTFALFHQRLYAAHANTSATLASAERDNQALQQALDMRRIHLALLENASDFIAFMNHDGRAIYVNRAGRQMVGLEQDQAIGDTQIKDYYPPRLHAFVDETLVREVREKGRWRGETYLRHFRTQAEIPVSDEHFIISDPESGRTLGLGTVTRDITAERAHHELQQANASLEQLVAKTKEIDRLRTEIFAKVNHELRTPLSLILGPTQRLLTRPQTPDWVKRDLEVVVRNGRAPFATSMTYSRSAMCRPSSRPSTSMRM